MKRTVIETLDRRKEMMIASLWSNSNYDDDKGTRKQAIADLEEHFDEAVKAIHAGPAPEEESLEDNPFFDAMNRGMKRLETVQPPKPDSSVEEVMAYKKDIDQ